MTFHLVHIGKGKAIKVEDAPLPDLTLDAPRVSQIMRHIAKHLSRRTFTEQVKAFDAAHTNYKPGKLTAMGLDQCRYCAGTDGVMCGRKTVIGKSSKSYCADHYSIVYTRGPFS